MGVHGRAADGQRRGGQPTPGTRPAAHPLPSRGPGGAYSKDVTVLLLHPSEEAGRISSKLQGVAQPWDVAQVQRRFTRSPVEGTALSTA